MKLSKYHGCGNDFIMGVFIDGVDYSKLAQKICDRHSGIGADGVILAKLGNPIEMVFYNADGSRGLMCGNGIRCLAKFIINHKLDDFKDGKLFIKPEILDNGMVKVNMGKPDFLAKSVGIMQEGEYSNEIINYNGKDFKCSSCFMTVDHLVIKVDDLDMTDEQGFYFYNYPIFTKKINANFVKIHDRKNISVRTYERGVGWTMACGSGSSATFAVLNREGLIDNPVTVHLKYGKLEISKDSNGDIFMKGPAAVIVEDFEYEY